MLTRLSNVAHSLLHLAFPALCDGCRRPLLRGEALLCTGCQLEIPRLDYHDDADNETALRLAGRIPFVHATSFAGFADDSLIRHLVHLLKYKQREDIGIGLGKLFGEELKEASWAKDLEAIVPVPLHPRKERDRGYNQTALLGEGMSTALSIPHHPHALRRTRHTESQTRKGRAARADNVAELFEPDKTKAIAGRHILLIDDVLTTGATLEGAAAALLKVPGVQVSIATLALAVR